MPSHTSERADRLPLFSQHDLQDETPQCTIARLSAEVSDLKTSDKQLRHDLSEAQFNADHDPLTGLLNHRAFNLRLDGCLSTSEVVGKSLGLIVLDIDNLRYFNNAYGHLAGDDVLHMIATRLKDICYKGNTVARFGGDEFAVLINDIAQTTTAEIEEAIADNLSGLSYYPDSQETGIPITVSFGAAVCPCGTACLDLLYLAEERLLWAKTGGSASATYDHMIATFTDDIDGFSMLDALVTAVDNKDQYTRRHSQDVIFHCLLIADSMGFDSAVKDILAVSALLHDVGKIGVPDAILRKPGKLTDTEFTAIKLHPDMGAAIVGAVPGLESTLDAVRYHHERYDGSGYPVGLRGEEIPLIARIMAVADAYSAMTMDRPYRKGMDRERVLSILADGAGSQWDKECVNAFLMAQNDVSLQVVAKAA